MDKALLVAMRETIAHRGPDGAGIWCAADGTALLGHRRLAIVDLSEAGAQPMVREGGRLAITFNGEIYNHGELREELRALGQTFVGHSDTEVLLAAYRHWGTQCLRRLRGMFAFAIYDGEAQTLFLARDRAGEKPLYWAPHRGGIVFASELKALMRDPELPRHLDREGLLFYLTYGYVPGSATILRGVNKLSPAHFLVWSLRTGTAITTRYWDLPAPEPASSAHSDGETLADELHGLLRLSVAEQLEADVPVAVLLSGGIDSSLITAIAAGVSTTPVRTYTVGIPGDARLDEARFAKCVADHFATNHEELLLEQSSVDVLHRLARQFDEPMCDSSMIPTYLLAKSVSRECKVVLGGDGGDELFGGYRSYQGALRQARLREALPSVARSMISHATASLMAPGADGRNGLLGLRGSLADGVAQTGVLFETRELLRLAPVLAGCTDLLAPRSWRRSLADAERGTPGAAMAADFRSYLPEDILVKVDRASMLCSLEVRAPFLDYRVVDFAYRKVPNALRASRQERKIVLKALARKLLPRTLDLDRKQGFSIPLSRWITAPLVDSWLEECRQQVAMVLCEREIRALSRQESSAATERLFAFMLLTLWMRDYGVTVT
jgi:asparagine synthase (glutamine-hydrolysing)